MDVSRRVSRRRFLQYGAAAAAVTLVRIPAASGQSTCSPPPGFPPDIDLYQQGFENWSREIVLEDLWTCAPRTADDVVRLANWAHSAGWRLRARGLMHNFSPLGPTQDMTCATPAVMVDTTQHLTEMRLLAGGVVRAGAGRTMDELLPYLEAAGRGFLTTPAPGNITVGGALAVDAHGAAVPAVGEELPAGQSFGSLSNLVTALEVVAWSPRAGAYELRRVERADPEAGALLAHLGRSFVTAAELLTGTDVNLRCQSFTDIPWRELTGTRGRTLASFMDAAGRAEIIWFPFTESPWFKVWSVAPHKPAAARETTAPYNYPFSDNIPKELALLAEEVVRGNSAATPLYTRTASEVVAAGLTATATRDLWGRSKNTLLYIRPTSLRYPTAGWVVHCRRADAQRVVSEVARYYTDQVTLHQLRGQYPMNGPIEIRCTGVERASDSGIQGAATPALSAIAPLRPEWDTAVWFSVLTFGGTPGAFAFYRGLERFLYERFPGAVRPEWSKGFAFTAGRGPWTDPVRFPRIAEPARATLDRLDPHRVFANGFLDALGA